MQKKIEYAQGNNSGVTARKRLAVQRQRELVSTPVVCCKSQEPKNKEKKKRELQGERESTAVLKFWACYHTNVLNSQSNSTERG